MKGYVYILRDKTGRFYIGSTDNIENRLHRHEKGYTQTTARMVKPKLVLVQEYDSLPIARRIESRIKQLKRRDYVERMVADQIIRLK